MLHLRRGSDPSAVRRILESLPDWFGDTDGIDVYAADAASPAFTPWLAFEQDAVVGVALVRSHFPETAELHLIAVAPEARGRGVGRRIVEAIVEDLRAGGVSYLTVHTVGPSHDSAAYAETRAFYRRTGFVPLEEHTGLGWWGPTLISVRAIDPESPPDPDGDVPHRR